jgi:hypothetical protein
VTSDHSIKSIDLNTGEISNVVRFGEGNMDGIRVGEDGNLLISHYEGRLYRVSPSGEATTLLYVQDSRCADFEYVPEKNLVIVPGLEANKVVAYEFGK